MHQVAQVGSCKLEIGDYPAFSYSELQQSYIQQFESKIDAHLR